SSALDALARRALSSPELFLDGVRRSLYPDSEHTFAHAPNPGGGDADGTTAGDLGLPRRLCRPARLPAHRAGDRRCGRAGLALDRPRSPGQPRARRAAQARPDEAAGGGARRPRAARPGSSSAEAAAPRPDRGGWPPTRGAERGRAPRRARIAAPRLPP